ncbi:MAG: hypothetical protein M1829_003866 [Trizodia sp. TS-e1964]|nr:MAG: hypothetical protein M1829_003866 [Trizodia sp. TS-e1964]
MVASSAGQGEAKKNTFLMIPLEQEWADVEPIARLISSIEMLTDEAFWAKSADLRVLGVASDADKISKLANDPVQGSNLRSEATWSARVENALMKPPPLPPSPSHLQHARLGAPSPIFRSLNKPYAPTYVARLEMSLEDGATPGAGSHQYASIAVGTQRVRGVSAAYSASPRSPLAIPPRRPSGSATSATAHRATPTERQNPRAISPLVSELEPRVGAPRLVSGGVCSWYFYVGDSSLVVSLQGKMRFRVSIVRAEEKVEWTEPLPGSVVENLG